MREVAIKGITARPTTVRADVLDSAQALPGVDPAGQDQFRSLNEAGRAEDASGVATVDVTEVTVKLEGARPEGAHSDIRVNGELLLGAILDETNQTISGVVRTGVSRPYHVEISLPDGRRIEFTD